MAAGTAGDATGTPPGRNAADVATFRRELHDVLGPVLTAAVMRADALRSAIAGTDPGAEDALGALVDDLRDAVTYQRLIARGRPCADPGAYGGLLPALRQQASRMETASGGRLAVRVDAEEMPRLRPLVEVAAYRICSEAMTNVARHANANVCTVQLGRHAGNVLRMQISDDGVGPPAEADGGVGLASMRRRAHDLGGECHLESIDPCGARVTARLPLTGG